MNSSAFAPVAPGAAVSVQSTFTSSFVSRSTPVRHHVRARPACVRMMAEEKKSRFSLPVIKNPFAKKEDEAAPISSFISKETKESESPKKGISLPVIGKAARGLNLLREDLFKTAPEKAGVGRQDEAQYIKPQFGDPGYKPQAYEVTRVSELGISPFLDDANAVVKVGGVEAVKKAAKEARAGKTAAQIKKQVLNVKEVEVPEVYDLPDYLKAIPEDTPRKGMTWKNYVGR